MAPARTISCFFALTVLLNCAQHGSGQSTAMYDKLKSQPILSTFVQKIDSLPATEMQIFKSNLETARTVYAPLNSAWSLIPTIPNTAQSGSYSALFYILSNHLLGDARTRWATLTGWGPDVNSTKATTMNPNMMLFYHFEHGDFLVNGAKLVTVNYTNPNVSELLTDDGRVLMFVDRVIDQEAHSDNFYNHMDRDEVQASGFGSLVNFYAASTDNQGLVFKSRLMSGLGTLFVPRASVLSNPLVVSELETLKADLTRLGKVLRSHLILNNFIFTRYLHENITWVTEGDPFISHSPDPPSDHPDVDLFLVGGGSQAALRMDGANITMTNGVMHLIDGILQFQFTVYTLIGTNQIFNSTAPTGQQSTGGLFMTAIQKIPTVVQALKSSQVTVFAPSSVATTGSEHFRSVTESLSPTASDAEKDNSNLAKLIKSCILSTKVSLAQLRQPGFTQQTMNGTMLTSSVEGTDVYVTVDGVKARILQSNADIQGSNGVIHVIDKVLALKGTTIWQKMTESNFAPQLSTFIGMLKSNDLVSQLKDGNTRFTVFAPSDNAFKSLFASPDGNKLTGRDKLINIVMLRHIVKDAILTVSSSSGISALPLSGGSYQISIRKQNGVPMVFYSNMKASIISSDIYCDNGVLQIIDNVLFDPVDLGMVLGSTRCSCSMATILLAMVSSLLAYLT